MRFALRTSGPSWRAAVMLLALGLVLAAPAGYAVALTVATDPAPTSVSSPARVLFIGDSVLDQQGSHAAFLLRQAGIDAKSMGVWGSGLLTPNQYDHGHTVPDGFWLHQAAHQIATFDPDVVGVYMNHNYWPPFPHDAAGHEITNLWSAAGQRMIAEQARALITILRSRDATVLFVNPIPAGTIRNADPNVWSPIWHGYLPVLRALHVPVVDSSSTLAAANGLRAETKPSCSGRPERVRPAENLHLTRYGAGRAGTALATAVAKLVHADLRGNAAPGDTTVALVPSPRSAGYWLIGCDGSVYHFGDAAPLPGSRHAAISHRGVVDAVATRTGRGLWLVTADGTIIGLGDAPHIELAWRPTSAVVAATGTPDGRGLLATTARGVVLRAGGAHPYGDLHTTRINARIVDIAATHDGRGYWLTGADGGIYAFGNARFYGSTGALRLSAAIVDLAPTPDGHGYWLLGADGGIFAFGDARFEGTGAWHAPAYPKNLFTAKPGPATAIVATSAATPGYWILDGTGRVVPRGEARHLGGDNNLAMLTP